MKRYPVTSPRTFLSCFRRHSSSVIAHLCSLSIVFVLGAFSATHHCVLFFRRTHKDIKRIQKCTTNIHKQFSSTTSTRNIVYDLTKIFILETKASDVRVKELEKNS